MAQFASMSFSIKGEWRDLAEKKGGAYLVELFKLFHIDHILILYD